MPTLQNAKRKNEELHVMQDADKEKVTLHSDNKYKLAIQAHLECILRFFSHFSHFSDRPDPLTSKINVNYY